MTVLLDVLRDPASDTLDRLLSGWLGPAGPRSLSPPAIALPSALREGLVTISGWPDLFQQNALRTPDEIDVVRGLGRFLDENQSVCVWGFRVDDADQADPPVWVDDGGTDGPWKIEDPVSRFLVKMSLMELVLGGDGPVTSTETGRPATEILDGLTRLETLGSLPWPYAGSGGMWFYAGSTAIGMAELDHDGSVAFAWRGEPASE